MNALLAAVVFVSDWLGLRRAKPEPEVSTPAQSPRAHHTGPACHLCRLGLQGQHQERGAA